MSGNGQNGTLEGGVVFSPGKVGEAFEFDGIDDRVRIPDSPALRFGASDLTLEAWIKAPAGTNERVIINKDEQSAPFYPAMGFFLDSQGKLWFYVTDCGTGSCGWGSSRQPIISPQRVDDDAFHHVAGVRRSTGYELYILKSDG
ncbi:MAG: LamG domain-containing protein [Acidobacteriota bacterium]|nr:LamG domain-containing protein [Acidobacteriota bacterium]